MLSTKISTTSCAVLLLASNAAFAEFSVKTSKSVESEQVASFEKNFYGNAHTKEFHKSIEGEEMTPAEHAEVAEVLPVIDDETWYGRVRIHFSRQRLGKIKNKSVGNDLPSQTLAEKGKNIHSRGVDVAIGYMAGNIRTELEYIDSKKFGYTLNAFTGDSRSLDSEVTNNTFLFNAYYELLEHLRFRPYVFAGIGIASNKASATFDGSSNSKRIFSPAWTIGFGTRFKLMERFYLDAAYRHTCIGKFEIYNGDALKLKGNHSLTGLSLGMTFLF